MFWKKVRFLILAVIFISGVVMFYNLDPSAYTDGALACKIFAGYIGGMGVLLAVVWLFAMIPGLGSLSLSCFAIAAICIAVALHMVWLIVFAVPVFLAIVYFKMPS